MAAMSFRGLSRPNASCAMGVSDESKNTFMELQRTKVYRYVIFKIDEKKREVVVEKTKKREVVVEKEKTKEREVVVEKEKTTEVVVEKEKTKKREVVVEKTGGPAESYDDFVASLPDNDCRYAVYDFDFVTSENCQKSKIFFIAWSPSTARIRAKMLYASSKDRFRRELDGIHYEIQATDPTEMDLEVLRDRAH